MRWRGEEALPLGPEVVARLLPQRPPLLLVDRVCALRRGERPELWAERRIDAAEPVLAGHFPGDPIWPGSYTMEGLGQTSLLLAIIIRLLRAHEARGGSAGAAAAALQDGMHDELAAVHARLALAGQVDLKFLAPVRPGDLLGYHAMLTHALDGLARFEVTAEVGGRPVARGHITGVVGATAS